MVNQTGLGNFDGNADGIPDLVDLAGINSGQKAIDLSHIFVMAIGQITQFLDHKVQLLGVYNDPNNALNTFAKIRIWYAGNTYDDTSHIVDLYQGGPLFFDRNNTAGTLLPGQRSFHVTYLGYSGGKCTARDWSMVMQGETFYVNGARYDIPFIYLPTSTTFKYITLRTPLIKGEGTLDDSYHSITNQYIVKIPSYNPFPMLPTIQWHLQHDR